ncbi:MAG: hypothetical protein V4678_02805 [Patescibacteria group bacterium]
MNKPDVWPQFKLPLIIAGAFLLAAVWILFGRLFFGVFGWMFFILLFTIVPLIFVYAVALTIVVAIRQRKHLYRMKGPFMMAVYVTLFALFMLGLSVPDGGDTKDSGGSALAVLMGNRSGEAALATSGTVAGWSIFIAFVASITAFILAFFERTKREVEVSSKGSLKQSN